MEIDRSTELRVRLFRARERGEQAVPDLLDRAVAVDPGVTRGAGIAFRAEPRVIGDQRLGLLVVGGDAMPDGLFLVVRALHEWLARDVVLPRGFRRAEVNVVSAPGAGMHAPAAQA